MATTPEGKVKKKVKEILDKKGAYYFMPATGGFGRSGVPDFIGCINGVFFGIECKAGKGIPTALQEREIRKIINAGGYAWVINEENVGNLEKTLEGL
jgi:Holliday junction resolvase